MTGNQITIGDNSYDVDRLRSLAKRDTPGAIIAQTALDVGEIVGDGDMTASASASHSAVAGD